MSEQDDPLHVVSHAGVRCPRIVYGTAWKKERTQPLVERALEVGFRGVDTADAKRLTEVWRAMERAADAELTRAALLGNCYALDAIFQLELDEDEIRPLDARLGGE